MQIWERLRGSLDDSGRRNTTCPSGLHPDGTCSCESVLTNEESSTRASISRIVMLAEALFEVVFFSELADCLSLSLLVSAGNLCCQKISNSVVCEQTVLFGHFIKVPHPWFGRRCLGVCIWVSFTLHSIV